MSKTVKKNKFIPRRDLAAMTLACGGFKNSNHGDNRKQESKDSCRKFKFDKNQSKED